MQLRLLFLFLSVLLATGGCGTAGGPESVAKKFWTAVVAGDKNTAKQYTTKDSSAELELQPKQPSEERDVEFGKAVETGDQVTVPTTLVTTIDGQDQRIPLITFLSKEDGKWKVDWNQTMSSMFGGMMGEMAKGMSKAMEGMAKEMTKSMEAMGKSFSESMKTPPAQ